MQDLRLIGVHEDGQHLLLAGPDGEHYRLSLDEALRAAARQDRPRLGQLQIEIDGGMRPREVQSMIRSGATTEEVADRAGWTVEKVRRYEGPILAERVHVSDQARQVRVRGRSGQGGQGGAQTLSGRVAARMRDRGVDTDAVAWDAWRSPDDGRWTVALVFAAGGRQRRATWAYDAAMRTVDALDDEARWLSADEPAAGPLAGGPARVTTVYDVEAEGGVAQRRAGSGTATGAEPRVRTVPPGADPDEPVDLMTAMRQRTTVGRRSGHRRRSDADRRTTGTITPALPIADLPEPNEQHEESEQHEGPGAADVGLSAPAQATTAPDEATTADPELFDDPPAEPAGAETPPLDEGQDTEAADGVPALPTEVSGDIGPIDGADGVEDAGPVDAAGPVSADRAPDLEPELAAGTDDLLVSTSEVDEPGADERAADEHADDDHGADDHTGDAPDGSDDRTDVAAASAEQTPRGGPRKTAARKGRTPVPSWDDIMFGAKRD